MVLTFSNKEIVATLSDLRENLARYRRRVQRGEIIPVEYYTELIGFLVPKEVAEKIQVVEVTEKQLKEFRAELNQIWEEAENDIDLVWITYHRIRRFAYVPVRVWKAYKGDSDE